MVSLCEAAVCEPSDKHARQVSDDTASTADSSSCMVRRDAEDGKGHVDAKSPQRTGADEAESFLSGFQLPSWWKVAAFNYLQPPLWAGPVPVAWCLLGQASLQNHA
ncbi:unnamed protein product [Prorocentrum cordatum]|uniref:Uncharacterized protein n=1 Tax=Prorocentrum cordatum TaxID=2364126 RepID=A0ABN9PHL3_9DINO|nr:unnamed protein product [Polarella glacialis]